MMLKSGINNCWSTPIYKTSISQEKCEALMNKLTLTEDFYNPQHDSESNLAYKIPDINILARDLFGRFFKDVYDMNIEDIDYTAKAWLTGTMGDYNMDTHNHTGAQFISVVYILAEEQNSGGEIVLQDPRFNANRGFREPFIKDFAPIVHKPKTGDVLIMPGYVYHFVRRYTSKLRLAMPIDIFIK